MNASHPSTADGTDLAGHADIERLVNTFYDKVRRDELLGFIFNDVAKTDSIARVR